MTHDEYVSPDQPGPIVGYGWVEACPRKTLESIPREKLRLRLPLYYRRWNGKKVSEGPYLVGPRASAPRFQFGGPRKYRMWSGWRMRAASAANRAGTEIPAGRILGLVPGARGSGGLAGGVW